MNIFVLDLDPIIAAQQNCDKHVVKIALEVTQMLCTAHHMQGNHNVPYKPCHINHPVCKWVRQTAANYDWAKKHGIALCEEYTYRYGKRHKCHDIILELPPIRLPDLGITPFARAMPDVYLHESVVTSYRQYYLGDKARFATWKKREVPGWFDKEK